MNVGEEKKPFIIKDGLHINTSGFFKKQLLDSWGWNPHCFAVVMVLAAGTSAMHVTKKGSVKSLLSSHPVYVSIWYPPVTSAASPWKVDICSDQIQSQVHKVKLTEILHDFEQQRAYSAVSEIKEAEAVGNNRLFQLIRKPGSRVYNGIDRRWQTCGFKWETHLSPLIRTFSRLTSSQSELVTHNYCCVKPKPTKSNADM